MQRTLLLAVGLLTACQAAPPRTEPPGAVRSAASTLPPASSADARFDAELSGSSYPFPVKHFELTSQRQKLRMAYMDVQPSEANGKTVLLLHGKNFSAAYWQRTIELLSAKGMRVIAPDQIGFGKSSKPEAYQFSFQALAENTRALLAALGVERVSVVGHSMGGMLATRFALLYPAQVERLALVAPIGLEDWRRSGAKPRSVDEWYAAELKATPDSIREYQKQAYYAGQWKPEYEQLIQLAAGSTEHPDYPKVAWASARLSDMIWNEPILYELSELRPPTLLLIGLRDRTALGAAWSPPEIASKLGDYTQLGKRAHAAIPGSRLIELAGVGHLPQVEAFDAYARALTEFLL
ncbi:MAG TPA: alpha/beta hydrolase [Polyangiaceae bacterium]